jgi:hypothetical protein
MHPFFSSLFHFSMLFVGLVILFLIICFFFSLFVVLHICNNKHNEPNTHTHTHIFEIAKKSPKWWLETNITLNENHTQNQIYKTC